MKLNNEFKGSDEFNKFYTDLFLRSVVGSLEEMLYYKVLVVMLCTILETNTEYCAGMWLEHNKTSINISNYAGLDNLIEESIDSLIEIYNNESNQKYDIKKYYTHLKNLLYIIDKSDESIDILDFDFRIKFGKHGLKEFAKIIKLLGGKAQYFKGKIKITSNSILETIVEVEISSILNSLIMERNSIIHNNDLTNSIQYSKRTFISLSVKCINDYLGYLNNLVNV